MPKVMQKIILFLERSDKAYDVSFKLGNLFVNRFTVDEEASFEVIAIVELETTLNETSDSSEKIKHKGIDSIGVVCFVYTFYIL